MTVFYFRLAKITQSDSLFCLLKIVMGAISILSMILLFVAVIGFIVLTYLRTTNNIILSTQQRFIPFRAAYDPTTGELPPGAFNNVNGSPQLQCPAGTSINVVGAFFDVFDPYGETIPGSNNSQVNQLLVQQCIPGTPNGQTCQQTSDCNGNSGTTVYGCVSGKCVLNGSNATSCPNNSPNGGKPNSVYGCADPNVCGYSIAGATAATLFPNPAYSLVQNQCAIRDVSALISAKCNGRTSCPDLSDQDLLNQNGSYPCVNPDMNPQQCITSFDSYGNAQLASRTDSNYCGLPFFPGWAGNVPNQPDPSGGSPNPANANLGYVIHGFYTCVPN